MKPFILHDLGVDIATLTAIATFIGIVYRFIKEVREDRKQSRAEARQISEKLDKLEEIHAIALRNQTGNKNLHRYLLQTDLKIALQRGWTTGEELEAFGGLYDSYVAQGGNGSITALYNRYKQLPLKEEGYAANAK